MKNKKTNLDNRRNHQNKKHTHKHKHLDHKNTYRKTMNLLFYIYIKKNNKIIIILSFSCFLFLHQIDQVNESVF